MGTRSRPSRPQAPWTEIAPRVVNLQLVQVMMLKTTNTPPIAPNRVALQCSRGRRLSCNGNQASQCAVQQHCQVSFAKQYASSDEGAMATTCRSSVGVQENHGNRVRVADITSFSTEPPLKPNHPIHRMNVPKVARGRFAPGIAFTWPLEPYLPLRAPNRSTPARAAAALPYERFRSRQIREAELIIQVQTKETCRAPSPGTFHG